MKKMFLNLVVVLSLVALSLVSCENKTTNAAEANSEPVENTPADTSNNAQSTDSTADNSSNPSSIDSTSSQQQSQKDSSAQSSN